MTLHIVSLDRALHVHLHHPPPPVVCLACVVEASIEVIDDLQGEAQEIAQAGNTFITYGPPMQLARVCTRPYRRSFVIIFTSPHAYVTSTLRRHILALGVWNVRPDL